MENFDVMKAIQEWEAVNLDGFVSGCGVCRCLSPTEGGGLWWAVTLGPMLRPCGIGYAATMREAFEIAARKWAILYGDAE